MNKAMFDYLLSSINILIPISMFVLLIIKNYSLFYILNYSRHAYLISIIFLATSLLEFYFLIFAMIAIYKAYNLSIYKHNNKILNLQYNLQLSNLRQLEEYQSDIRRISHDIHNHKAILYSLIKSKDYDNALDYLENYGSGFSNKNFELLTNNKILNALFLTKKDVCINSDIDLKLDINLPKDFGISDFDLCIIVGNLMDNAIEACKKVPINENRYIHVKSSIINKNFVLNIKNNFNGDINISKSKILTSKNDCINHGLGMSNIESTVLKYQGNCDFSFDKHEFTSLVIVPIN